MFRALLSCLPKAVLQSHPYKYILYGKYLDFCPDSTRNLLGFLQKKSPELFTKISSDEELVTLHLNHTRNHWNNTVYTLYLDALYGVLMQYVLLYCDLCNFVTILSRFLLFCCDLRCFVAIYAVLSRRHDCSGLFSSHLRTFLSNFVVTDVYALSLKFLKSLPAVFFPFLV